jgi:hypothetical protein
LKRLAPTILVAALLVATATAFAVTEHLKLEDSPVIRTAFAARFSPELVEERISFRLRREEDISLDIADSKGRIVKHAVGSGVFGPGYQQFAWDGRDDSGQIVPDGTYRVQLTLEDENRTIEFPNSIAVDSTPPTIEVDLQHQVFSPDGDGRADRVDIRYGFGEPAWGILYVNGKRVGRSRRGSTPGTARARSRASIALRSPPRTSRATSPRRPGSSRCASATSSSSGSGSRRGQAARCGYECRPMPRL